MFKDKRYLGAWAVLFFFVFLNIYTVYGLLSTPVKVSTRTMAAANTKDAVEINEAKDVAQETLEMKKVERTVLAEVRAEKAVKAKEIAQAEAAKAEAQKAEAAKAEAQKAEAAKQAAKKSSNITLASRGNTSSAAKTTLAITGIRPVNGSLTSGYGQRGGEFHKGVDIVAPVGTDVYAFADGVVTFSGWNTGGYGNLVIIDHGNGIQTYYAHNSKLLVNAGQTVTQGEHIADVGKTGDASGAHCHFEIRKDGNPVNPAGYIK